MDGGNERLQIQLSIKYDTWCLERDADTNT
jgi:hypothetical protein